MISTAKVAKQAHRLGVGDRVIEKDYVLSWLLVAILSQVLRVVRRHLRGLGLI